MAETDVSQTGIEQFENGLGLSSIGARRKLSVDGGCCESMMLRWWRTMRLLYSSSGWVMRPLSAASPPSRLSRFHISLVVSLTTWDLRRSSPSSLSYATNKKCPRRLTRWAMRAVLLSHLFPQMFTSSYRQAM